MKLGINTYTYMWSIGYPGAMPEKPISAVGLLEKAHQLGVKVVQFGPNLPLDKLDEASLSEFHQCATSWGIEVELATRGLETDHLVSQLELCRRLGSTFLRTIPELNGQSVDAVQIPEYILRLLPMLAEGGIRLGLENGKIPAKELRWAVEEMNHPLVGIVLDTTNSLAVPEGWKEVTRALAPYVMCLHYKDFIMKRFWNMMGFICEGRPAGQGQVETDWLLEALKESRYDFNIIVELWPPEQETLSKVIELEQAWAEESVAYLRRFVKD